MNPIPESTEGQSGPLPADKDVCGPCGEAGLAGFGWRIGLALAFAGQGMVFGLGYNNALKSGESPAFGSAAYGILHAALLGSALVVGVLLGGPLLRETLAAFRQRRLSVEALFVLSAGGALGGSLIASFTGSGSVYYEVVSIVLCVYAIGKQVGAVQKSRLGQALSRFRMAFDSAWVAAPDGGRVARALSDLQPEDRVLVAPGEPVPVDGRLLRGSGYLRETPLTGEPAPVRKGPGDQIRAGTWSVDGNLLIEPHLEGPRALDGILAFLDQTRQRPSRMQAFADRLMHLFVPVVSLTATGTFLGWLLVPATAWWEALFHAMSVLLVACPCALGLALPTGIWSGLFHLGQRGVLGRHGQLLEALAECDTVVFDKTGTLTRFQLEADTSKVSGSPAEKQDLLEAVAALGRESPHPVSAALAHLGTRPLRVTGLLVHPGLGLSGEVAGRSLMVGEAALLREHGVALPAALPAGAGKPVHLACDQRFAGTVFLRECLRPDSEAALQVLLEMGLECHILSGDPEPANPSIGGVPVTGNLHPAAKAREVESLKSAGRQVLFIGDGINDLPAMQASHASLAIDHGAALAAEFADGLLIQGRAASLPSAIHLARRVARALRDNLRFALLYNLAGMSLAAAGLLHPVVAALLMVGSSAIVSWRALRAAGGPP